MQDTADVIAYLREHADWLREEYGPANAEAYEIEDIADDLSGGARMADPDLPWRIRNLALQIEAMRNEGVPGHRRFSDKDVKDLKESFEVMNALSGGMKRAGYVY